MSRRAKYTALPTNDNDAETADATTNQPGLPWWDIVSMVCQLLMVVLVLVLVSVTVPLIVKGEQDYDKLRENDFTRRINTILTAVEQAAPTVAKAAERIAPAVAAMFPAEPDGKPLTIGTIVEYIRKGFASDEFKHTVLEIAGLAGDLRALGEQVKEQIERPNEAKP